MSRRPLRRWPLPIWLRRWGRPLLQLTGMALFAFGLVVLFVPY